MVSDVCRFCGSDEVWVSAYLGERCQACGEWQDVAELEGDVDE
jgi:hypothetical protein